MKKRQLALALASALLASVSLAQETEETEEQAAPEGPPVVTGRDEAVGYLTRAGMTFELARGARLVVPPNLPVGTSRRTVFAYSRARVGNADVATGFRRHGAVMSFDGAIDATQSPVVVSLRAPRSPARANERLVLAMEQAAICNDTNRRPLPGGANGLCSGWELLDARHEDGQIFASIPNPGGFRLVFGTVPAPEEAQTERDDIF